MPHHGCPTRGGMGAMGKPQHWSGDREGGVICIRNFIGFSQEGRGEARQAGLRLAGLTNSRRLWGIGAVLIVWYLSRE